MTATLTPYFVLSDDEVQVVASRLGVQAMPAVLGLRPRYGTESDLTTALDHASRTLAERELIRDGEVTPELAQLVQSLQRPERELAMRLVTPDGTARVTVIRQGTRCISAVRVGNELVIEGLDGEPTQTRAAQAVLRQLPVSPAAEIEPVGAPLDATSEALSGTHDAALLADRIRSLGADTRTAMRLGSAFASRQAFAEIVYHVLDRDEGRITRVPSAVGVFYTKRGRIVGAPSTSPSGQLWTTLKAGSDHAIKQAIGQLVELPTERWEEF